jgi:hypothetical protein
MLSCRNWLTFQRCLLPPWWWRHSSIAYSALLAYPASLHRHGSTRISTRSSSRSRMRLLVLLGHGLTHVLRLLPTPEGLMFVPVGDQRRTSQLPTTHVTPASFCPVLMLLYVTNSPRHVRPTSNLGAALRLRASHTLRRDGGGFGRPHLDWETAPAPGNYHLSYWQCNWILCFEVWKRPNHSDLCNPIS